MQVSLSALFPPPAYATLCLPPHSTTSNRILSNPPLIAPLCHPSSPHTAALWASRPPHSPSASLEAILALSLPFPSQWQAVSPSEKTPDLKRALRNLLSKMKVNVTRLQWNIHTHTRLLSSAHSGSPAECFSIIHCPFLKLTNLSFTAHERLWWSRELRLGMASFHLHVSPSCRSCWPPPVSTGENTGLYVKKKELD